MPKRTDIKPIPPSPPLGGEGKLRETKQGEGGVRFGDCPLSLTSRWSVCPSPPEGGEGLRPVLANRRQDHSRDAFGVFKNVAIGEADDLLALAFHINGARGVLGFAHRMAVAVKFDDKPVATRREVGDVMRSKDHLADEFDALQPTTAQDRPELCLGRGHFGSQRFGVIPRLDVALGQLTPPSPWRRFASPVPLPLKGARAFGNASSYA
jgi:hypothetical protein